MNLEEARMKARILSENIAGEMDGMEQDFYAAQAAWHTYMAAIENAKGGEELAKKFLAFVSHYTGARSRFADIYKDITDLGKKLDPVFMALDGK